MARKLSHVTEKVSTKSNLQLNIDEVDNNTLYNKIPAETISNLFFFHHHKIDNVEEVKYLLFYLLHLAFKNTKEDVQVMKI